MIQRQITLCLVGVCSAAAKSVCEQENCRVFPPDVGCEPELLLFSHHLGTLGKVT